MQGPNPPFVVGRIMPTIVPLTSLFCALSIAPRAAAEDLEVLFLGNSYTAVNSLPDLVEGLALAAGHTLDHDRNTPGGNTLGAPQSSGQPHMSNAVSLAKIASRAWDYVVLLEQSVIPSIPWSRNNYMIPGATSLDASIDASDPATRVLLYQTWGRRNGGSFCIAGHCRDFADFDAMQDALTHSYSLCAEAIGADVAPVGEAWRLALRSDPLLVLHAGDGSHPNLAGSYLAACVFFAKLYGQSPLGSSFDPGLAPGQATFLQEVADQIVFSGVSSYCTATANSHSANGALMSASGSNSYVANDLVLVVSGAVPGQAGLFFYGRETADAPFGDGLLCVGGNLLRLGAPTAADATGGNTLALDYSAPPMNAPPGRVLPGSHWNFQHWYRDPAAAGTGFNLSDGLSVVFQP